MYHWSPLDVKNFAPTAEMVSIAIVGEAVATSSTRLASLDDMRMVDLRLV